MRAIIIHSGNIETYHREWLAHHRLRHKLFFERLGWEVQCYNGMEYDQFDTPAAHYAVVLDHDNEVCAVSRLLPTTATYMIETLWPDWMEGELPKTEAVWEASRFGCSTDLTAAQRRQAIRVLFQAIYEFGRDHHIAHYLMVMPRFIFERIIVRNGYAVEYIGELRIIDGLKTCLGRVQVCGSPIGAPLRCPGTSVNR